MIREQLLKDLKPEVEQKPVKNCSELGRSEKTPASSCREIFLCNEDDIRSGFFWIRAQQENKISIQEQFCNMEDRRCGIKGGWMQIVDINMTDPTAQCPYPLQTYSSPKRMCVKGVSVGCSSVVFPSSGVPYSRVCGQAIGYQYRAPDAFNSGSNNIDGPYVDGLSITHGMPRKHIWSYAIGLSENHVQACCNCPCAAKPGLAPAAFVGDNYHCESGNTGDWEVKWYTDDPVWDGKGCGAGSTCCASSGLPWFCRTLACETTDDIEVRWCCSYSPADENFGTELLQIYVL